MRTLGFISALGVCLAIGCTENGGSGTEMDLQLGSGSDLASSASDLSSAPDLRVVDAGPFSFSEIFPGADGSMWPSRWTVLGGVAAQSQQGGRGRMVPQMGGSEPCRIGTSEGVRDIDVTFQLQFENIATQGIGYYVRQNGGWLRHSATHGQGYAVFVEGFRGSRIGVWREIDGQEQEILAYTAFATALQSNVLYQARLRVTQATATSTRLQARIWLAAQAEPMTWQLDTTDNTASLQNVAGGMAVDSYSSLTSGITAATFVDNITAIAQ